MSSKEELIVIEHDVKSEKILEKAHEFDTMRMVLKYAERLERNIKRDLEMKIIEDNEGVMEDTQVGMFNMTYQSQRRISGSKAKKLCYALDMNPEFFKSSKDVATIGPSEDNGLLTFVRYTQLVDELKKRDESLKEIFTGIEKPDSEDLVDALESVWSLRKHIEDTLKETKKDLKEGVNEYMEEEKGFNPQMDRVKLVLNDNIAYQTKVMSSFSGNKFLEVVRDKFEAEYTSLEEYEELKGLGELEDDDVYDEQMVMDKNAFREKVMEVAIQKMEEDVKEKSFDIIKRHFARSIVAEDKDILFKIKDEDAKYDDVEDGEPVDRHKIYDFCMDVLPSHIANAFEKHVNDEIKMLKEEYAYAPDQYLEQHVKNEVNFIKFDPPRGFKSSHAAHKEAMLNKAREFVDYFADMALSATPDSLSYLADRMDKCNNLGIDFRPFQHINREKVPQLDGVEKSIRPRRDVNLDMGM